MHAALKGEKGGTGLASNVRTVRVTVWEGSVEPVALLPACMWHFRVQREEKGVEMRRAGVVHDFGALARKYGWEEKRSRWLASGTLGNVVCLIRRGQGREWEKETM